MNITPALKDVSLADEIYAKLKSRLIHGHYKPGDRLSMRKLAVEFGTSPMPVREALKRLASERVIESAAAKAFNVPSLSDKRAADLFDLRALLEGAAIVAAHNAIPPILLEELSALCDRMDAHLRLRDFAAYMADNYRFHFLIYRQAENPDIVSMIEQLWMQTGPSLLQGLQKNGRSSPDWNSGHKRLLDALASGQTSELSQIMRSDVEWGAEFYRS
ncbi:GntR family transcriptional regulator [Roseovarius sp. EL26]|uniref:GntR family transcriptional regulator n=1 Tax=Roseovarius sp. EL26 TaxID=2126672 RepID=UPI0013C4964D|nr:GntR family transcriptional regulator [Roseovarius sp. EL26]